VNRWNHDPTFEDVERVAEKLERAVAKANLALHKLADIDPGDALKVFIEVESKLLRFDSHATKRFEEALEEKRVRTLAHGDLVMTCVLSAAVALSEFKKQPHTVTATKSAKLLSRVRQYSTTSFGLLTFATLTFYTVLGRGVGHHAAEFKRRYSAHKIRPTR
jgi:hypothetical protein